jgi:hypothetical protein
VLADYLNWLDDNALSSFRVQVILEIGRLSGDRRNAVAPLTLLLIDGGSDIRKAAARSLGQIGPDASAALPALREALNDWKNSLYSLPFGRHPRLPRLVEDSWMRHETERYSDADGSFTGIGDPLLQEKSVQQVVREAIELIESGSDDHGESGRSSE